MHRVVEDRISYQVFDTIHMQALSDDVSDVRQQRGPVRANELGGLTRTVTVVDVSCVWWVYVDVRTRRPSPRWRRETREARWIGLWVREKSLPTEKVLQ